jgi:hypothetical protein
MAYLCRDFVALADMSYLTQPFASLRAFAVNQYKLPQAIYL